MKLRLFEPAIRALAALGCFVTACAGAEFFVAERGDDASAGSADQPWQTIAHAANHAKPGDTIFILPGDYRDQVPQIRVSGEKDGKVVFRSSEPHQARVGGFIIRGDHIAIEGFLIDGDHRLNRGNGIYAGMAHDTKHPVQDGCIISGNRLLNLSGTAITSGRNAVVTDNHMHRVHRGLFVNGGTLVENNEIDTLTAPLVEKPAEGVLPAARAPKKTAYAFFAGDGITFRGNHWHGTYDGRDHVPALNQFYRWGTDFFTTWDAGGIGSSNQILIENNRCFYATHAVEPLARSFQNSKGLTMRNNVFAHTCYVGILPHQWQDVIVENNTLINCGAYPIWSRSEIQSRGMVIRNNLIATWNQERLTEHAFRPAESGIRIDEAAWVPSVTIGNNLYHGYQNRGYSPTDFTATPEFVDPDRGNFHLAPASPGIGVGAVLPPVSASK